MVGMSYKLTKHRTNLIKYESRVYTFAHASKLFFKPFTQTQVAETPPTNKIKFSKKSEKSSKQTVDPTGSRHELHTLWLLQSPLSVVLLLCTPHQCDELLIKLIRCNMTALHSYHSRFINSFATHFEKRHVQQDKSIQQIANKLRSRGRKAHTVSANELNVRRRQNRYTGNGLFVIQLRFLAHDCNFFLVSVYSYTSL